MIRADLFIIPFTSSPALQYRTRFKIPELQGSGSLGRHFSVFLSLQQMITWTLQSPFFCADMLDITCWKVATAVKITEEPDTSPGRIGLLTDQLPPRTAFWEAEMWVRPEVIRRDQTDPPPPSPLSSQRLMWTLPHNLNPQHARKTLWLLICWHPLCFLFTIYFLFLTSLIFW